jgi:hypothetical protein
MRQAGRGAGGTLLIAVALVALAAPAGSSDAQRRPSLPPPAPRDAPVVAGPTDSGARLLAFDRGRRLCLALSQRGDPDPYPDCERPSGRLRSPSSASSYDGSSGLSWQLGTVSSEVAGVELVFGGGPRVRVPTEAGDAYDGRYAGQVRFYLAEYRGFREPLYIRLLGADGATLAVPQFLSFLYRRVGPPRTLLEGGAGERRWSLRGVTRRTLAGVPGHEERIIDLECIDLDPRRGRPLAEACANPDFAEEAHIFSSSEACRPIGRAVTGMVTQDVRAVTAVLGSGKVRRLRLHRLPAQYAGRRAFALALGLRAAVRRLVVLRGDGTRRVLLEGLAPGSLRCGENSIFAYAYTEEQSGPRGPLAWTVYDRGVLLCSTLGSPRPADDCEYPPLEDFSSIVRDRTLGDRNVLALVVPRDVARAVLRLRDGRVVRAEATFDGPYAGRYRGLVGFVSFELPVGSRAERLTLVDDRGGRVFSYPLDSEWRPTGRAATLLRPRGGLGLRVVEATFPGEDMSTACLRLTGSQAPDEGDECGFGLPGVDQVFAQCSPRRIVLWGAQRNLQAVTASTDRGEVEGRVAAIPRRFQRRPTAAYQVVIPARAALRSLTFTRRNRTHTRRLSLSPAVRQCGYGDFFTVNP